MSNWKAEHLGSKETFAVKDWSVFVPILTSALALAWQVGAMLPVGGFALFSISDHLVSAAREIPFALAISSLVAVLHRTMFTRLTPAHVTKAIRIFAFFIGPAILGGAYILYWANIELPFVFTAVVAATIISTVIILARRPPKANAVLLITVAALISLSISLAADLTYLRLWRIDRERPTALASITTKSGISRGAVLMSGERGYLIYSPPRSISFVRFDEVLQVDYQRRW